MKIRQCSMQAEDAPPGPWLWPGDRPRVIDGIELESRVPTRFFQSVDAYPPEWGELVWRVQLNRLVSDRAVAPVFRTFYPGVEWNLRHPDFRWFLTAWFHWDGPGPRFDHASLPGPAQVRDDTALFRFAWLPKPTASDLPGPLAEPDLDRPLYLRSRVDARDRRSIAAALRSERDVPATSDSSVISLDDIIEA